MFTLLNKLKNSSLSDPIYHIRLVLTKIDGLMVQTAWLNITTRSDIIIKSR